MLAEVENPACRTRAAEKALFSRSIQSAAGARCSWCGGTDGSRRPCRSWCGGTDRSRRSRRSWCGGTDGNRRQRRSLCGVVCCSIYTPQLGTLFGFPIRFPYHQFLPVSDEGNSFWLSDPITIPPISFGLGRGHRLSSPYSFSSVFFQDVALNIDSASCCTTTSAHGGALRPRSTRRVVDGRAPGQENMF